MKKNLTLLSLMLILFLGCKKEKTEKIINQNHKLITQAEAKDFLNCLSQKKTYSQNESDFNPASLLEKIEWENASSIDSGKSLIGKFEGQASENGTKLGFRKAVFHKDKEGNISMNILEFIPDIFHLWKYKGINKKSYDGKVMIYDGNYKLIHGYDYTQGLIKSEIIPADSNNVKTTEGLKTDIAISNCTSSGYAYLNAQGTYEGVVVLSCHTTYVLDIGSSDKDKGNVKIDELIDGGVDNREEITPVEIPRLFIPGQDHPPVDIKNFVKCFGSTHNLDNSYKFSVYVDQPVNGSTSSSYRGNVGHTFIGITKSNNSGTFTQFIGFYPQGQLSGALPLGHLFKDNGATDYDVSITFDIPYSAFESLLAALNSYNQDYSVWDHNCTNFSLEMATAAGVYVPNSQGNSMVSRTPGQLGEDLREYKKNNPGIGVNDNGGQTGKSKGPCN